MEKVPFDTAQLEISASKIYDELLWFSLTVLGKLLRALKRADFLAFVEQTDHQGPSSPAHDFLERCRKANFSKKLSELPCFSETIGSAFLEERITKLALGEGLFFSFRRVGVLLLSCRCSQRSLKDFCW